MVAYVRQPTCSVSREAYRADDPVFGKAVGADPVRDLGTRVEMEAPSDSGGDLLPLAAGEADSGTTQRVRPYWLQDGPVFQANWPRLVALSGEKQAKSRRAPTARASA